ncbi:MAG: NAD(P)-dependent dehydrogenase (short-subunit alcohol dehydrogenase family) [Parasphingorhabdus sp.]|jgi:NAD(P)-dependent dehydrogenase (short-subunit alcohol dehydrogenase family)
MQLEGQTAIITGASSGMGAATAQYLSQHGVKVGLLDINRQALESVAELTGGLAVSCNVTSGADMESAVAEVTEKLGLARILVCCAGIAPAKRIVGRDGPMDLEAFRQVIEVNLIGTFNAMRVSATAMTTAEPVTESGERGVIINTASVAAYEGQIGQAAYASSKAGIVGLTLPAAREFSRFGVRVMTIAPGLIGTPMLMGMPEEVQDRLAASVPFPKRFGQPEEYARLVEHIITNEMLNGDVIRLDGAIRLQPT